MPPIDDYLPDPPRDLGYDDFRAARARFLARLSAQAEIARLERAFSLSESHSRVGAAGVGRPRIVEASAGELPRHEPGSQNALRSIGEMKASLAYGEQPSRRSGPPAREFPATRPSER